MERRLKTGVFLQVVRGRTGGNARNSSWQIARRSEQDAFYRTGNAPREKVDGEVIRLPQR